MRPPILCFANVKSCGNTPKINGALHAHKIFIIFFQCHTCIRRVSIITQRCSPKLQLFTLIGPFLHFYWPVLAAVSLTPVEVFRCFKTLDAAVHRIFFSAMTLEKKLCVSNVWLFTEGKFYSIFNMKSSPKSGIEAFVCKRARLSQEVMCDGAPSRRQQRTKHFVWNMKIDFCLLISA